MLENEISSPEVQTINPDIKVEKLEKAEYPPEPSICPNPSDCVTVGEINFGRAETAATIQFNPNLKDPIAIWAEQLSGIVACVDANSDMRTCVTQSDATDTCKTEFLRVSDENNGDDIAAFDFLFLSGAGPCSHEGVSP